MRWLALIGALGILPPPAVAAPPPLRRLVVGAALPGPGLCLAEAPSDPRLIYVGTADGRVLASSDGGRTWTAGVAVAPPGGFGGSRYTQADLSERRVEGTPLEAGVFGPTLANELSKVPSNTARIFQSNGGEAVETQIDEALAGSGIDDVIDPERGAPEGRSPGAWTGDLWPTFEPPGGVDPAVRALDVHPRDPRDVLAATGEGLRRSRDGGGTWPVVLGGATAAERRVQVIARDPRDPAHVLVGTGAGLFEARDGGERFEPLLHADVADADIRAIAFDPDSATRFIVATEEGLLATDDGGRRFSSLGEVDGRPDRVRVDPRRPQTLVVGTTEGLFRSEDAGKTFRAVGPLAAGVGALTGDGAGAAYAGVGPDLWVSVDGGAWQSRLFGDVPIVDLAWSRHRRAALWILSTHALAQLSDGEPVALDAVVRARYERLVEVEPDLGATQRAALERAGLDERPGGAIRFSGLLPRVTAFAGYIEPPASYLRYGVLETGSDDPEVGQQNILDSKGFRYAVFAGWDVADLLFRPDEGALTADAQARAKLGWTLRQTIASLYTERRRVQLDRLLDAGTDGRARLARDLRLEELTAHLNALAGPLFTPFEAL
ncbi:MAG: hypothetical protein H6706_30610 [Myxococcales bacterium]|nr:hypothetical protein [Myxococcales bacterium]